MKKISFTGVLTLLFVLSVPSNAETLAQYVSACRTQLSIPSNVTLSTMDCYDGDLFANGGEIADYIGYKKVTDQVDMAFICRWLKGDKVARQKAISVEATLHNRQNGNTCFFSAIDSLPPNAESKVSPMVVSPLASNASSYWTTPDEINTKLRCIGCHVSGVYIATPRIAPYLSKYGLLNNGHDTLSNVAASELSQTNPTSNEKYRAVVTPAPAVSAFATWNVDKHRYLATTGCSEGCHLGGGDSPQQADITATRKGPDQVLPGIESIFQMISNANAMEPTQWDSHYRWINLDTSGDGSEKENFASAKSATSLLVPYIALPDYSPCSPDGVPTYMEAHPVGVHPDNAFTTDSVLWLTEKLRTFNAKDGLVCMNSDQDSGVRCRDFDVSYLCPSNTWTGYYNRTVNTGQNDDNEARNTAINNMISASCGTGVAPVGIKARFYVPTRGGNVPQYVSGPADRLARFSQFGLTCNNADQPDGQCSNYVVRYQGCAVPPATATKHLTNVFTGKQLTASSGTNGAAAKGQPYNANWNTQAWAIETVKNTEYVRLKNTGTNTYLNVTSSAEQATVVTSTSANVDGQLWIVEKVIYSNDVRLKNLATGKYLTSQDPALASDPNYLAIYSQGKNTGWTSQRWVVN